MPSSSDHFYIIKEGSAVVQDMVTGAVLEKLGEGASDDEALREVLKLDTDAVDAAVRERVLREFPDSGVASPRPD